MYTQRSIVLNRPIADVFGFLSMPENWPLIEAGLLEYQHLSEPAAAARADRGNTYACD